MKFIPCGWVNVFESSLSIKPESNIFLLKRKYRRLSWFSVLKTLFCKLGNSHCIKIEYKQNINPITFSRPVLISQNHHVNHFSGQIWESRWEIYKGSCNMQHHLPHMLVRIPCVTRFTTSLLLRSINSPIYFFFNCGGKYHIFFLAYK